MIAARRLLPLALLIGTPVAPLFAQTVPSRTETVRIASDPGVTLAGELQQRLGGPAAIHALDPGSPASLAGVPRVDGIQNTDRGRTVFQIPSTLDLVSRWIGLVRPRSEDSVVLVRPALELAAGLRSPTPP